MNSSYSELIKKDCVTVVLIIANVVAFILELISVNVIQAGALYGPAVAAGQYYRIFTSMFLHSGISHIAMNMIALMAFGNTLEPVLGHTRFAVLYLGAGIVGSVLEAVRQVLTGSNGSIGASGAIFGLLGAILCMATVRKKQFRTPPLRQVVIGVIVMLVPGLADSSISFSGHVFGLIGGFLIMCILPMKKK